MQSTRLRILCTEDDEDTRELITLVLSDNNCEVVTTETPALALELARATSFDLYLLDNWIPGMSGTELCEALRLFDSQTPILFYSGAAYPKDKAEAYASGAQGYLVKPADNDELVAEVFRVITESQKNRATTDQKALGDSVPETNSSVAAAGR
jgi:two-component system phosphate regulon response regulator PhoB